MNTRRAGRALVAMLFTAILTFPFLTRSAATQSADAGQPTVNVETADGLRVVTFSAAAATVKVYLPNDIRAGDTISGTVVDEPKGNTNEERAKNQSVVEGMVIEINGKRVEPFSASPQKEREGMIQQTFWIYDLPKANPAPNAGPNTTPNAGPNTTPNAGPNTTPNAGPNTTPNAGPNTTPNAGPNTTPNAIPVQVSLLNRDGTLLAQTIIPVGLLPSKPTDAFPYSFNIPPLGQTGKPIVITGPFDGDSSNTTARVGTGKPLEVLAESPREVVTQNPSNVIGATQITVKEGTTQTTGNFRNLGVNLTAPKTSLLKGESTVLKVEVQGLEGIKESVPLTIESHGVITMEGGMYQPLVIQPSQVGADGRYSTTRGVTGVQAGGWATTATVETRQFTTCMVDDLKDVGKSSSWIVLNIFTGDYTFECAGCAALAGQPSGPAAAETNFTPLGRGNVTHKGCVFTLADNTADRKIMATIDMCTHVGTASVQVAPPNAPKMKFTITDRNMTDNTCAVH